LGRLRPHVFDGLPRTHVLIETGTCTGNGVFHCRKLFREIHTVEIEPALHANAAKRLARLRHIRCHLGPSPEILQRIIDPWKSTTFWLDAHYSAGDETAIGPVENQCPLLAELDVIFAFEWQSSPVILVDDLKMFCDWYWEKPIFSKWASRYDRAQWPTLAEITAFCAAHGYAAEPIHSRDVLRVLAK
jgi:hypothetical protein